MTYSEICDVPFMSSVCDEAIKKAMYIEMLQSTINIGMCDLLILAALFIVFFKFLIIFLKAHLETFVKSRLIEIFLHVTLSQ